MKYLSAHPEGMSEISRWLSGSDTTGKRSRVWPHPEGMPEAHSLGNRRSGIPPGCDC